MNTLVKQRKIGAGTIFSRTPCLTLNRTLRGGRALSKYAAGRQWYRGLADDPVNKIGLAMDVIRTYLTGQTLSFVAGGFRQPAYKKSSGAKGGSDITGGCP
jgi:hypothetical protein